MTKVDRVDHSENQKAGIPDPVMDGPAEFICKTVALKLREDAIWTKIFGEFIDPYKRMDYSMRNLPALRIYNNRYRKESESWFITGEVVLDIIWPASLRRVELQQYQDTVSSGLLQQFRRPAFFTSVEEAGGAEYEKTGYKLLGIPGLNELGKTFDVDKSLGFELGEDEVVPLTQISVNFRVDLRQWDLYLEENLRTKEDPFEQTLGSLDVIAATIEALRDDGETEVTLDSESIAGGP